MISPGERVWLTRAIIISLLLANLPLVLGFLKAPSGTTYTGIDSTAPGDVNVYLSYLEQARQGQLVFRDLFTSEPQRPMLFNPFWLALGWLSSLLHLPGLAMYFLSRIVLGAVLLAVIYIGTTIIFADVLRRRIAFLLAVFASGIGAWAAPFIDAWFHGNVPEPGWPMDLWVSEAFTFLSLHHSPHFLAATILILLVVWWLMRVVEGRGLKPALYAGLAMLALFSFHPFHAVTLGLITVAFFLTAFMHHHQHLWRTLGNYALAWLIATPAILYHAWIVLRDPLGSGRAAQNILLTTWPGVTVLSYGFLLVGAVVGAVLLWRTTALRSRLLVAWVIAHLMAIYAPVFFNRRLTQGLNIALALLAAAAVAVVIERWRAKRPRSTTEYFLPVMGLFVLGLSTLWVTAKDLSVLLGVSGRDRPLYFYLQHDYRDAFRWLRNSTDREVIVLSSPVTGNFIPGWSGRRVVAGHNIETIRFEEKRLAIRRFYDLRENDEWRRMFLERTGATHVVVGPWEGMLGAFDGQGVPYLRLAFERPTVRVYRVDAGT